MLNSAGQIIEAKTFLEGKYTTRDAAYRKLRQLYNADYWSESKSEGVKLVYNLISSIVDRYTDLMSLPPDWRMIPDGLTPLHRAKADREEKLLYSQWELNNILIMQSWQANLQSLLGFFGFVVLPNFGHKEKYVKISAVIPDYTLPMPRTDNIQDLEFVILKNYDYTLNRQLFEPTMSASQKASMINQLLYLDENKIIVVENGKETLRIEHDFGFIPAAFGQNGVRPHSIEGRGDVDQAVGLNQYLNELISWQADIMEYAANPLTVFEGLTGDQKMPSGVGGQVSVQMGGSVKFASWPGTPPTVDNMINRVIQAIQDMTNMNDPMFARNVPSGTSGAAVTSFLSGIQAAMLRKQVALGDAYVRANTIMLKIIEKMHANKELLIRGTKKGNVFVNTMKGSEIDGNYRSHAIWPGTVLDAAGRVNLETIKLNSRLQSRRTTMENVGIVSPEDELELIRQEDLERINLEALSTAAKQGPAGGNPELAAASQMLGKMGGGKGAAPSDGTDELVQAIEAMNKIKDAVYFGGKDGDNFVIVLASMNDKATIVSKLPEKFKGKVTFRKFNEETDAELQLIVDSEQVAA